MIVEGHVTGVMLEPEVGCVQFKGQRKTNGKSKADDTSERSTY